MHRFAHGLFIGVGNYTKSFPKQDNLEAPLDAEVLARVWEKNRGNQFPGKPNIHVLQDVKVSPRLVLDAFDKLAAVVKPDDLLVFHLGGHGVSKHNLVTMVDKAKAKLTKAQLAKFNQQRSGLGEFLFLCGNFDFLRVRDTSISLDDMYEKLVKLPCHKVIMLDACNSAAVKGTDVIRLVTKDGVGPIIFAACQANESAIEFTGFIDEPAAGLFAQAIVKTIRDDFGKSKKTIGPDEMFTGLRNNVTTWVTELRKDPRNKDLIQEPLAFVPVLEKNFAILGR